MFQPLSSCCCYPCSSCLFLCSSLSTCFADSEQGCNCNSIPWWDYGEWFSPPLYAFCSPSFPYQWLNTRHASTICFHAPLPLCSSNGFTIMFKWSRTWVLNTRHYHVCFNLWFESDNRALITTLEWIISLHLFRYERTLYKVNSIKLHQKVSLTLKCILSCKSMQGERRCDAAKEFRSSQLSLRRK